MGSEKERGTYLANHINGSDPQYTDRCYGRAL